METWLKGIKTKYDDGLLEWIDSTNLVSLLHRRLDN